MSEGGAAAGMSSPLARVPFPPYTVRALSGQHVLVAGGGGSAKTGVPNGFQIFELQHNGVATEAEEVAWHETGDRAIMNCVTFTTAADQKGAAADPPPAPALNEGDHVLAAGLDDDLQLYYIRRLVVPEHADGHVLKDEDKFVQTRRRRKSESQDGKTSVRRCSSSPSCSATLTTNKRIGFDIVTHKAAKSDFSGDGVDGFQRVVREGRIGGTVVLVTGGCDGHVRVWKYPALQQMLDIAAHTGEVDDVDIDANGSKLISIGKDKRALVWSVKDSSQLTRLEFESPRKDGKYLFKKCRFAVVTGGGSQSSVGSSGRGTGGAAGVQTRDTCLFSIHNAVPNSKMSSYIARWSTKTFVPEQHVHIKDSLSALAVSDDGRYLSVGTMNTGSVLIYISFSLQLMRRVDRAHQLFVTGLEFLPDGAEARAVSGNSDVSVISISVDKLVNIHHVPQRGTISVFFASVLVVVVMVATFVLCSFLNI